MASSLEAEQILEAWWSDRQAEVEPTLSAAGITSAWWSLPVEGNTVVQDALDLEQCLKIIAQTAPGSDPHRPGFASQVHQYLDRPIPQATPFIIGAIITAVEIWEPRLQLDSVKVLPFAAGISSLVIQASWSIPESSVAGLLDIAITLASSA